MTRPAELQFQSVREHHSCAILDDGSLKCWGWNNNGKVGISGGGNPNTPQIVDLGVGRTAVSVSSDILILAHF